MQGSHACAVYWSKTMDDKDHFVLLPHNLTNLLRKMCCTHDTNNLALRDTLLLQHTSKCLS